MRSVALTWAAITAVSFVVVVVTILRAEHDDPTTDRTDTGTLDRCRRAHPAHTTPADTCEQMWAAEFTHLDELPEHVRQQL